MKKADSNYLTLPKGVEVSPVGLKITAKLSYGQWADLLKGLQRIHRSILWILGDALVYGEERFGQRFSQEIGEYSEQTLLNAMWVSTRVEPIRRLMALSWSHHQQVASLEPDEQSRFLELAIEKKLAVHELRKAIQAYKLLQAPEPKPDWQEPLDPPVLIAASEEDDNDNDNGNGDHPSAQRPGIQSDFNRLLGICRALRLAEKRRDQNDAARLRTALDCFISEHDRLEEQVET
jgi:hypothetical protein